jgi:hypothetical protein
MRGRHWITEKGIMSGVSVSISKVVSNFTEANKKLMIVYLSKKLLKDLENHQRMYTESIIKMLKLSKKYPSCATVPFMKSLTKRLANMG